MAPEEKGPEEINKLDVLRYEFKRGWKRLMIELEIFFDGRFGSDWRSKAPLDGYYNLPGPQRATCLKTVEWHLIAGNG